MDFVTANRTDVASGHHSHQLLHRRTRYRRKAEMGVDLQGPVTSVITLVRTFKK
jgi:hypothetical protein